MSKKGQEKQNVLDLGRTKPSKKQGFGVMAVLFMPLSVGLIGLAITHSVSPAKDLFSISIFSLSAEFRNALLQGVLVALGFIGIMVFFYLDKIHESDKDFITAFHTKNLNKSTSLDFTLSQIREGIYDWKLRIRTSVIGTAAILAFPVVALVMSQEIETNNLQKSLLDLVVLGSAASGGIMIGFIWDRFEDMLKILNNKLQAVYHSIEASRTELVDVESGKQIKGESAPPTNKKEPCVGGTNDNIPFEWVLSALRARESSTLVIATVAASASLVLFTLKPGIGFIDVRPIQWLGFVFALAGIAYREVTIHTIDAWEHNFVKTNFKIPKVIPFSWSVAQGMFRGIIFRGFLLLPAVSWSLLLNDMHPTFAEIIKYVVIFSMVLSGAEWIHRNSDREKDKQKENKRN